MIINARDFIRPEIQNLETVENTVKEILTDIKTNGDVAVNYWSNKIDGRDAKVINLLPFERYELDDELAEAIKIAYQRIQLFCEFQAKDLNNDSFTDDIGEFGYLYQPIELSLIHI